VPDVGLNAAWGREDWASYVLDHVGQQAVLLSSGARLVRITGKSQHVPRLRSDGGADWYDELEEIGSDAPEADTIELVPKKLANVVALSNESVADASVDSLDEVGLAMSRAAARALGTRAFSNAAATAKSPAGLLHASRALPSATGTVNVATIRARIAALLAIGARPNAIYVSGTGLRRARRGGGRHGARAASARPDPAGRADHRRRRLHVVPLTAGTAIVAESRQLLVGLRQDAQVEFSEHARFSADAILARVVLRATFDVNDATGVSVIKPA
jgi:hypothetical protein